MVEEAKEIENSESPAVRLVRLSYITSVRDNELYLKAL